MSVSILLLYTILITSSICMLITSNPINSVLFLMLVFLSVSFIFISIGADFIGFLILIVYLGAIAILFLFTVMLISVKRVTRDVLTYFIIGSLFFIILAVQLFFMFFSSTLFYNLAYVPSFFSVNENSWNFLLSNRLDSGSRDLFIATIGIVLVYEYPFLLILVSFLLLISIIGSISLTNYKRGYSVRRQYNQLTRNNKILNIHIYHE